MRCSCTARRASARPRSMRWAIGRATGMRVLRARGIETESDIPFAGLAELVSPLLDRLDAIPEVQARALRGALALGPATPHDRFTVPAGLLSLLGVAAEEQPVLAAIDDAQWLDEPSLEAFLFAGRRLEAEGIAMLGSAPRRHDGGRARGPLAGAAADLAAGRRRGARAAVGHAERAAGAVGRRPAGEHGRRQPARAARDPAPALGRPAGGPRAARGAAAAGHRGRARLPPRARRARRRRPPRAAGRRHRAHRPARRDRAGAARGGSRPRRTWRRPRRRG